MLVVSGFVSTEDRWLKFEEKWSEILKQANLAYFRMSEYNSYSKEFESWRGRDNDRTELLKALIETISKHAMQSFAAGILLRDWRRGNEAYQFEEEDFAPYSICGWACVERVFQWRNEELRSKQPIIFMFEDGDTDKGQRKDRVKRDFGVRIQWGGKIPTPEEPAALPL
jgi:hypothetical protein